VWTLGLSAYYHDSAAALLRDDVIIAAAQEERFSRKKQDPNFPKAALTYCLEQAGISLAEVAQVVFYEKPLLTFDRLLETYVALAPRGLRSFCTAMPIWLGDKLYQKRNLLTELSDLEPDFDPERLLFAYHHRSHAASAYFPSPFQEALILTMDGVGEWATMTLGIGRGNQIELLKELRFPHSLGLLYSAFTTFLGFKVNSGEYKVMGLAPYGRPVYQDLIRERLMDLKADGTFRVKLAYFDYCTGLRMTNRRFARLFGMGRREAGDPLEQHHLDLAASIQAVTEEIVCRLVTDAVETYGIRNLCLAGGVGLNCVANGVVLRRGLVDALWVQPAAGDAGGALGAAFAAYHQHHDRPRTADGTSDAMSGAFLGPAYDQDEIERRLTSLGATFRVMDDAGLHRQVVGALTEHKVVGWFQGRMEFGPRALGSRSILADARVSEMQRTLNLKIKYRESFRPFAPAVLEEHAATWFDLPCPSPYMSLVGQVRPEHRVQGADDEATGLTQQAVIRSSVPAVTHVDHSSRLQTVSAETNPRFHRLLETFREATGCPMLVNTSFNVRGEPIVATPEDAFRCFMNTEMDALAIGDCYLEKGDQDPGLRDALRQEFDAD